MNKIELSAINLKTNDDYPRQVFYGYSLAKAKKLYRELFGLVGKRNIHFITL